MSEVPVRKIIHVDMDAFYASVEQRDDPALRGRPVAVGGSRERGVVAAASYEARAFGVHSAMPTARARRLCPQAVFLFPDHGRYSEVSARVMAVFGSFTPLVEPISLDEAFLDVTGSLGLFGPSEIIAAEIRARVLDEEGLTCSVGVAPNKFLAKLASEAAKPRAGRAGATAPTAGAGVVVVEPGRELEFLHPLPVQALWGVGPATLAKLTSLGIGSVGDLAAVSESTLRGALGQSSGAHLWALAHALDDRPVVADQRPKSIGHEETFAADLFGRVRLETELVRLSDAVGSRLRRAGVAGRTVTLKVRFGDFSTITRSATMPEPVDSGTVLARTVKELLTKVDPAAGVRLLGVSVSNLGPVPARQLSLLGDDDTDAWSGAEDAVDRIRARFGAGSIGPAAAAGSGGLRVKRQGDQQWGPGEGPPGASRPANGG